MRSGRLKALRVIGAFVLVIGLFLAILLPGLCRALDNAERVSCASNLRQIGFALLQYAGTHDGRFPATLEQLVLNQEIAPSPSAFVCPASSDIAASGSTPQEIARHMREEPGHLSYVYLGAGLTNDLPADQVLMYEHLANHGNRGMNVLFGDGHIEFYEISEAKRLLESIAAGNPRTMPANAR